MWTALPTDALASICWRRNSFVLPIDKEIAYGTYFALGGGKNTYEIKDDGKIKRQKTIDRHDPRPTR
jgi:hypothetical protein